MIDNREQTQRRVTSQDGTPIAVDQLGDGPPIILVAPALSDRTDDAKLAALLAERFTVVSYDRRGRGDSGDTAPYAVEREVEDLRAVVDSVGGSAYVFGHSSGAVLALRAASSGVNITKLALFEPPFRVVVDGVAPRMDSSATARQLLAEGRRSEAVKHFMRNDVGVPPAFLFVMRVLMRGMWSRMAAVAHTLPYDYAVVEEPVDGKPLADFAWVSVQAPTLLIDGSKSPATLRRPAELLAAAMPGTEHRTLHGQHHGAVMTAPKVVAASLVEFFES